MIEACESHSLQLLLRSSSGETILNLCASGGISFSCENHSSWGPSFWFSCHTPLKKVIWPCGLWRSKMDHLWQSKVLTYLPSCIILIHELVLMQYFPALIILYNFWFYDGNGRERTRMLLTSAAYVHLKHSDLSKHTRNLSPASRAILLSGPTGMPFGNDYVFLLTCLCLFFFLEPI